jgi:hypothetical protein
MEPINSTELLRELKQTASALLKKEISTISGYSKIELRAIVQQTILVSHGIKSGEIHDVNRAFYLTRIAVMVQHFVRSLAGLMVSTVEKLWNALIKVLWGAISKATGLPLEKFNTY